MLQARRHTLADALQLALVLGSIERQRVQDKHLAKSDEREKREKREMTQVRHGGPGERRGRQEREQTRAKDLAPLGALVEGGEQLRHGAGVEVEHILACGSLRSAFADHRIE